MLLFAACESAPDVARHAATRDSTGIAIRELRTGSSAATIDLRASDQQAIQLTSDDTPFYRVVDAVRLQNGCIAVGNGGSHQVLVFDARGRRARAIGREERGPGEFQFLSSVSHVAGDTVAAFDGRLRRVSVVTAEGVIAREFVIQPPDTAAPSVLGRAIGATPDRGLILWLQVMPVPEELPRLNQPHTVGQVPVVLFAVDSTGRTTRVFGVFPGEELYLGTANTPDGVVASNWGPAPFGRWTGFGMSGERVHVFRGGEPEFRVYSPAGDVATICRLPWRGRNVTADDRERQIEDWLDRFSA
jgi:hypothetical protein